nr:transposase [Arthrobacter sp. Leaf137]
MHLGPYNRHLQAVWKVKVQLSHLVYPSSLEAKELLEELVKAAARPETNRLYRTVCRWKETEVNIVTGATTGKVEVNNTSTKFISPRSAKSRFVCFETRPMGARRSA